MKKILIFTLVIFNFCLTFSEQGLTYSQIKIPLDNKTGVPCAYVIFGQKYPCVEGFEIDKNGNFYFLGGDSTILACFSDRTQKYRRQFNEFHASSLYITEGKLYLFDRAYNKNHTNVSNSIFVIELSTGHIFDKHQNIIRNVINSCEFKDTSLILEVFDKQKKIDMSTELGFALYSLSGKFIKQVNNRYNLPDSLKPNKLFPFFLGTWNNYLVYQKYDYNTRQFDFFLRNNEGKLISTVKIDENLVGKEFYLGYAEHKKIRNDNLYILGYKGKDAIITILPLKDLFKLPNL
jgi:hypothetical protein